MTSITMQQSFASASPLDRMLHWAVFAMFAAAFVVYIEPAPVDLFFAVVLLFFARTRLPAPLGVTPLLVVLILYNVGGFLSYLQVSGEPKTMMFIITSAYMAVAGIIIAYYVSSDPVQNFQNLSAGWIIGATLACVWAFIDYFKLPSPFPLQVLPGRATGLFKDPNVFSTFIIFPGVYILQNLMLGTSRRPVLNSIALAMIVLGVFLSFSRGAWMNFIGAVALMFFFTYVISSNLWTRTRLILYVIGIIGLAIIAFMILMSIPAIQKMFFERAALVQYYDSGETGRFGNQLRSLPDLVVQPFGYGPFVFAKVYGGDPHNTFVNSFSSYGWLGGISYMLLVLSTLIVGAKSMFTKTPWQLFAICAYCPLVTTILQGVQIDTEHWRHFYWMLGLVWGLFAATLQYAFVPSYFQPTPANGLR